MVGPKGTCGAGLGRSLTLCREGHEVRATFKVGTVTTRRNESVSVEGGEMDGLLMSPDTGAGAGILLLQEIFGVGKYLQAVGERLVALGYTVLAPDLFWRIERNVALEHDDAGLNSAFELVGRFDPETGISDSIAALDHLRHVPETSGRAGVMGFCLGGRIAYSVATLGAPDVAVSYYGSGIVEALDEAVTLECPVLFHFGSADPYIPPEQIAQVEGAIGSRPNVTIRVHDAGHAFDNHEAPMFHVPDAARSAWEMTVDFLVHEFPADTP